MYHSNFPFSSVDSTSLLQTPCLSTLPSYHVPTLNHGSKAWCESLDWKRNAPKMAILTRKSKIFIKAKVIFMKSCLLGHVGFMIRCILNNFIFSNKICKKGHRKKIFFLAFLNLLYNTVQHIKMINVFWLYGLLAIWPSVT